MTKKIKQKYNPLKMLGSYLGILLGILYASAYADVDAFNIYWLFYAPLGLVVGWGIHSLIRKYVKINLSPNFKKIILTIIVFLIIPVPFMVKYCRVTDMYPCPKDFTNYGIKVYTGFHFITDNTPISHDFILTLSVVGLFIVSYILVCFLFHKLKKNNS